MGRQLRNGRWFTTGLLAVFAAVVWFGFWAPNRDAAQEVVEARTKVEGALFPLTIRVVRAGSGQAVPGAAIRWTGPGESGGEARTAWNGEVRLEMPGLGRYRLGVLADPERGYGALEIPYRYKIGAEREPVHLTVPEADGSR